MAQAQGLAQRKLQHFLGPMCEGDAPGRGPLALVGDLLHLPADVVERYAQGLEGPGGTALSLTRETKQEMFCANVVVVQRAGLFLGKHHNMPCTVRKSLKHTATL